MRATEEAEAEAAEAAVVGWWTYVACIREPASLPEGWSVVNRLSPRWSLVTYHLQREDGGPRPRGEKATTRPSAKARPYRLFFSSRLPLGGAAARCPPLRTIIQQTSNLLEGPDTRSFNLDGISSGVQHATPRRHTAWAAIVIGCTTQTTRSAACAELQGSSACTNTSYSYTVVHYIAHWTHYL